MGSSLQQVKEKGSCLSSSSSSSSRSLEAEAENNIKKCCTVCKTTKTPLWRNGPKGPKSLCNACGIRYRKKHKHHTHTTTTKNNASLAFAENEPRKGKVVKSRNRSSANNIMKPFTDRPRQLGEVERAALLLMAISCGALFG